MENSVAYCRLCVAQRFYENLVNFDSDICQDRKLSLKLSRIGVDITAELLPKTVCYDCLDELERTASFLDKVQQAEITLLELVNKPKCTVEIKEEKPDVDNDHCFDDGDFTLEDDEVLAKLPLIKEESEKKIECKQRRKRKKNRSSLNENNSNTVKKESNEDTDNCEKTWKNYVWKCCKCLDNFENLAALRTHSITEHKACCSLKCIDCSIKPFVNYETFANHVRKHKKYLKFCCFLCNKFCDDLQNLKTHTAEYKKLNICRVCGEQFLKKPDFEEHIIKYAKSIHFSKRLTPKIHQCEECMKIFKKACQLSVHKAVHMKNRSRDHTCFLCAKAFYTKGELNVHLDMHENKQRFQCDLCSRTFRLKAKLRQHIIRHSGIKPFSCEYCGKNFRFSWDVKAHIKVFHIQEMKFLCNFCEKKFRTSSGLKIHLRQHTGEKPFGCEQCCHYFTNHSNYYKHMKRRHGMVFPQRRLLPKIGQETGRNSTEVGNIAPKIELELNLNKLAMP